VDQTNVDAAGRFSLDNIGRQSLDDRQLGGAQLLLEAVDQGSVR